MILAAIDIGGSGSRFAVFEQGSEPELQNGPALRVGGSGIDASAFLRVLLASADAWRIDRGLDVPGAVVVGMSGLLGLVEPAIDLPGSIRAVWPGTRAAVASDAVTAVVGALGMTGGAVVAAGTGVVGLGTDFVEAWHRVDGWGHVLGDEGGGAWIGAAGLKSALRAHDGRGGSPLLLESLRARFGEPESLPWQIYTRDDRAGVLAAFAKDVADAAAAGDGEATAILREAGRSLARTAIACLVPAVPRRVALVGGLLAIRQLTEEFAIAVSAVEAVELVEPHGDPMSGAARLAEVLADDPDRVPHHPPFITTELS